MTLRSLCALALVSLLGLSSCAGLRPTPTTAPDSPTPHRWPLAWADEFDRDDIFATGVWSKIERGQADWNNTMSSHPSLFDLRDGVLILRGKRNDLNVADSVDYLTGGVYTKGAKTFDLGRIEVRCRLQAAQGAWPAIWMLPSNAPWPNGGEIDIMERLNFDSFVYQTIHSHYTVKLNKKTNPKHYTTAPIDSDGYNVYAVEILPDELRFFVNDRFTFSYPRLPEAEQQGQFPFGKDFYLLIDMQLGGKWVGKVKGLREPVEMHIDWVRYYSPAAPRAPFWSFLQSQPIR